MSAKQRTLARVTLRKPIPAIASGEDVSIVDASLHGVRVAHTDLLYDRERCAIAFDWNGHEVEFVGRIRWTKLQRGTPHLYQSGLEIASIDQQSSEVLRSLIQTCVERALDEQVANAHGIPPPAVEIRPAKATQLYARHELIDGLWRKTTTSDPRQPDSGFTVPTDERPDQVTLLRTAYAAADPTMRKVIRRFAEMSIFDPEQTWPHRFTP